MNIYCVIFMCTFGSNTTDTEMPQNNSLLESSSRSLINETDVASMILPEKGMAVPQFGDIVMDLPNMQGTSTSGETSNPSEATAARPTSSATPSDTTGPSLAEILLPPAPLRNKLTS